MTERLLTPEDLAHRYGVPVRTIYSWNYKGTGPRPLVIGRHRRWRLEDLLAWEAARVRSR